MNIKRLMAFWIMVVATAIISISCGEGTPPFEEIEVDLTDANRNFLFNTNAARSRARVNGVGPVGFIFRLGNGTFSGRERQSPSGRSDLDVSPVLFMRSFLRNSNSVNSLKNEGLENNEDLPDCFQESFSVDDDGFFEYTLDFGEGCDFFGEIFHGKITETGNYSDEAFKGSTVYDKFGGETFEINGTYSYDGSFEGIGLDEIDSVDLDFTARYNYEYQLNESYDDGSEGIVVDTEGSGMEESDNSGYKVLAQETNFRYSTGESFTSIVTEPLFTNYTCFEEDVFTHVMGVEEGSFTYDGLTEEYSVDYGDGRCDNVIEVRQGDEVFVIDLAAEWEDLGEEDPAD